MSELELALVNEAENCTVYTIQFVSEDETEFERFMLNSKTMPNTIPI